MAKVLFILTIIGLVGCGSSGPRYNNIWVHSEFDQEERSLAWDTCSLRADQAKTNYLAQTPRENQNTTSGALNNFTRKLNAGETRGTAFRVCMRSAGFKYVKRCVKRCGNDS